MIQLCVSIALLGLQMKSWDTVVTDVVAACNTSPELHDALLQFLAVLPEEAADPRRIVMAVCYLRHCDSY
jgi:transportin-3